MIKGSLKDASLPGILQFLANEVNRSYRLKFERGSLQGEVVILNGVLASATYGLLRGEDAVCEFLTWEDGIFWVERLAERVEPVIERNITLRLHQGMSFADQASFLLENNVGLNTVVRSSKMFGTPEWQESSKLHPLQREDFLILGWLSDGRTMRQAMRDFAFDLVQATAILYRLVLTRSVEVVRPGADSEAAATASIHLSVEPALSTLTPEREHSAPDAELLPSEPEVEAASSTRRTNVLPIISIDIERLMKATFAISEFGFLALKNPALDEGIRSILLKVESGSSLESTVEESSRPAAATLSTYRYCLERGYISNPDPVLPLTADLLLSRTELDQYLLQRRRVTGELLRDLSESARNDGVKLSEMLVKAGFLSQEDLDTVQREQARFAMRQKPSFT